MKRVLLTIALLAAACAPPLVLVSTARAQEHDRQCFFVAAGKSATADGAILLGYNNDWAAANWMSMRVVGTRGASSHRFLKFHTKVAKAEGGLNEHQLGLVFGAATDIDKAVLAADPYLEHGYGYELWDLILRRCRTARQAIDTLGRMAASKGFKAEAAGSLAVGDPGEVWVFELLGGRHWAAARVPDDAVWIHPNMVCIREIDLRDQERFRGSPDLEEFAVSLGRYDPDDGPFDVAWAYADRDELQSYYNTNRLWGAVHKLAPSLRLPSTTPWAKLPVHVVPDKKVTRQRIAAINRYHYEGTPLDQTDHYRRVSPHAMTTRPICVRYTDYSTVTQLRGWLPDAVGGVVWVAQSRPCSSAYVPFYGGITAVPRAWRTTSAFAAFRAVAHSLDRSGKTAGRCRYGLYHPLVHRVYGAFEKSLAAAQRRVEAVARRLGGPGRSAFLTRYSSACAAKALSLAKSLPARMR